MQIIYRDTGFFAAAVFQQLNAWLTFQTFSCVPYPIQACRTSLIYLCELHGAQPTHVI